MIGTKHCRHARRIGVRERTQKNQRDRGLRLAQEGLEERQLLSAFTYSDHVNFDGLTFAIVGNATTGPTFTPGANHTEIATDVTVAVGPEVESSAFPSGFQPRFLLEGATQGENATVTLSLNTDPENGGSGEGTFTVDGKVAATYNDGQSQLAIATSGTAGPMTFEASALTSPGGFELSGNVGATFQIGGIGFTVEAVGLNTTTDTATLTGNATLDALGGVAVNGSATVAIDGNKASLQDVTGTISSSSGFEIGGCTFTPQSLSVSYVMATATLGVSGSATFTWNTVKNAPAPASVQISLGDEQDPGILIQNGQIQSLNGSVTANFNFAGLTVAFDGLGVKYVKSTQDLDVYGSASISNNGSDDTFQGISASLGSKAAPGLVLKNGDLQSLQITVNGGFTLFGADLSADGVAIGYESSTNELALSGTVEVKLASAIHGLVGLPENGITINTSTGAVDVNGLNLQFGASFGLFTAELGLKYTTTGGTTTFKGNAMVGLPGTGDSFNGEFTLTNDQLTSISLDYSSSGQGIPLGTSQVYIVWMGGSINGLNNLANLQAHVSIDLKFGRSLDIGGTNYALFTASGGVTVTPSSLTVDGSMQLLSTQVHDPLTGTGDFDGLLGSVTTLVGINWKYGVYTAEINTQLLGAFTIDAGVTFNNSGDLTVSALASLQIPDSLPWVGGTHIGDAHFYMQIRPADPNDSYIESWASLSFLGTGGVMYNIGSKEFSLFYGEPETPAAGTTEPGNVYQKAFLVQNPITNLDITITEPKFEDLSQFPQSPAPFEIQLYNGIGDNQEPVLIQSFAVTSSSDFVNQSDGTAIVSLQQPLLAAGKMGPNNNIPLGEYYVRLISQVGSVEDPSFELQPTFQPPQLIFGEPTAAPAPNNGGLAIPLTDLSNDPEAHRSGAETISLYYGPDPDNGTATGNGQSPENGTGSAGASGVLIATFPDYANAPQNAGKLTSGDGIDLLRLPNGIVTYRLLGGSESLPVSFTWTTFPETAQVSEPSGPSYLYGIISDGSNDPVLSNSVRLAAAPNPTPGISVADPAGTFNFKSTKPLPATTVTDPGNWPLDVTITASVGQLRLRNQANTTATSLTYTTPANTTNSAVALNEWLSKVIYVPSSPAAKQTYAVLNIAVSALVGPDHVPYSNSASTVLSKPNTDLLVSQVVTNPTTGGKGHPIVQLTITNKDVAGAETATGVEVRDLLPMGVTVVGVLGTIGSGAFTPATGVWNVGQLAVGQSKTITLTLNYGLGITGHEINTLLASGNQPDFYPADAFSAIELPKPGGVKGTQVVRAPGGLPSGPLAIGISDALDAQIKRSDLTGAWLAVTNGNRGTTALGTRAGLVPQADASDADELPLVYAGRFLPSLN
jgi:hypothetical protein